MQRYRGHSEFAGSNSLPRWRQPSSPTTTTSRLAVYGGGGLHDEYLSIYLSFYLSFYLAIYLVAYESRDETLNVSLNRAVS